MPDFLAPLHMGGGVFTRKTADQATSAITFIDSTGLSFPVLNGQIYRFRFVIFFTTNAATVAIRLGVNGPTGTLRYGVYIPATAPSGAGSAIIHASGAALNAEAIAATAGPGAVATMAIIEGIFIATAGGTLTVRHGSETASATTILANSFGELYQVD